MNKFEQVSTKLNELYSVHGLKKPLIRKTLSKDRTDFVSVAEIRVNTKGNFNVEEKAKTLFCLHFMKVLNGFSDIGMKNLINEMVQDYLH